MAVKLNSKGNSHANGLVKSGKVNKAGSWSFSADDGNKILGENNWSEYSKWHLAIDTSAEPDTKEHYKYPFGKNGEVYRSALRAIRSRAAQQDVNDVFEAAGRLMEMLDKQEDSYEGRIERRFFPMTEFRVEPREDGQGSKLVGHAALFDSLSEDLGGFREKIDSGAFRKTIRKADVRALFNHDSNYVLGRTASGTLTLKEDNDGLRMENEPPDTQWARDLRVSIERGDINQMSFGFRTVSDRWETKGKESIRTIEEVELVDVSVVTYPAYADTRVALRSFEEWQKELQAETSLENEKENQVETHTADLLYRQRQLEVKKKLLQMEV